MKQTLLGVAIAFLIVSPAIAATHKATSKELATIKQAFSDRLKDPYSVKLKDVQIKEDGTVCGEINAKNSYGAYTGYTRFNGVYFARDKNGNPFAMILAIDDGDSAIAQTMCTKAGL